MMHGQKNIKVRRGPIRYTHT